MFIETSNIFVSGTVARASKVNENFNSITSGLADGTKDLNMANITTTTLTASTATIGSLSFDDITAEDVTASGNLSVRSESHEMALSCPGVSGLVKIDNEWCASFKGDVMTVPSLVSNGAGTFSDNVSITSGTEKYLSVSQTGEDSGEVRVTPYGVGTVNASALNLKTNDTTRVVIAGGGNVSIGGNFTALSPLHVSGNIRASGAIINGYTQLGESSPAIKMKLLSGTMSVNDFGGCLMQYGIGSTDVKHILGIQVGVETMVGIVPPNSLVPDLKYTYTANATEIIVYQTDSAADIKGRPVKVLITYI